ncbi:MAG: hypothetical protein FWD14_07995, partial [Treponema sp.]|nr:hypothetical protein [Treponema sp.]
KYFVISREEYFMFNSRSTGFTMQHHKENIERYKETDKWEWKYRIIEEKGYMKIEFIGFLDFEIYFSHSSIYFLDPPYRYSYWFNCDKIIRDEWRKYMYQVIKIFGGDRVIYLPDQMLDHYLDKFDQIPVLTFDEIEKELINEYGINKCKLENFYNDNDSGWYFIDNFNDLDMENKIPIEEFKIMVKDK